MSRQRSDTGTPVGMDGVTPAGTAVRQYRDSPVDVKIVISALWIAMLFVFAYVDIFGFYRADVLNAALEGKISSTAFTVDQVFLTSALVYILPAALMVVLSLLLRPRVNRVVNIAVSLLYAVTIVAGAVGERWAYYVVGSGVEVLLLLAIARLAWRWPPPQDLPSSTRARGITTPV